MKTINVCLRQCYTLLRNITISLTKFCRLCSPQSACPQPKTKLRTPGFTHTHTWTSARSVEFNPIFPKVSSATLYTPHYDKQNPLLSIIPHKLLVFAVLVRSMWLKQCRVDQNYHCLKCLSLPHGFLASCCFHPNSLRPSAPGHSRGPTRGGTKVAPSHFRVL